MSANWDHTYTLFCNLLLDLVFFQASTYRQTSSFSHNISETPHDGHCDSKCIFALHVTAAATAIRRVWYVYKWATLYLWKLRKTNQMRKAKAVYKGETTWSLAFCRNWKAGRGVEELSGGRTGGLQVCPDWTVGLQQLQANWNQAILFVRATYVAFSGWSWVGSRDKDYRSCHLLIKSWAFGAAFYRISV